MNKQRIFSYWFWKETQGEGGMRFEGVKIEGNKTYSVFRKTPDRDLYHLTIVLLGKNFDIVYKKGSTEGSIIKKPWR